jgi:tRNA pseudouridine55 synthase
MNGIILVDKPAGPTSAEIVRLVKARLNRRARVGHLGTLDPFATGVLPILVGEATKLAPFLQEGAREYAGLITLGSETDTLDCTGQIIRTAPGPNLDRVDLAAIAHRFTGTIEQTPPIFSAIKRAGVPLYKLARRGVEVEPPAPRQVHIECLDLAREDNSAIRFRVRCSSGMYLRSLARDIGNALYTAAHLSELRRIRSGIFLAANCRHLDQVLATLDRGEAPGFVSMRSALAALPEVTIDPLLEARLRHGDSRVLDLLSPNVAGLFKVVSRGELVAIARRTSHRTTAITRVFRTGAEELEPSI